MLLMSIGNFLQAYETKTNTTKTKVKLLFYHAVVRIFIVAFILATSIYLNNLFIIVQNTVNIILLAFSLHYLKKGKIIQSVNLSIIAVNIVILITLLLRNLFHDDSIILNQYGTNTIITISLVTLLFTAFLATKIRQLIISFLTVIPLIIAILFTVSHNNILQFFPSILFTIFTSIAIFPIYFIIRRMDITERKKAILYEMVSRKAEQEHMLKIKAEYANQAKTEFLTNISHELLTPLNAITGFTNLLLEDEKDDLRIDTLLQIRKSSRVLVHMIDEIIDLANMENDELELKYLPYSLPELLSNIHEKFRAHAGEKNIGFNVSIESSVPEFINGDSKRMSQVLSYLCDNAIKFTSEGSAGIVCKTWQDDNENTVEISIYDTGIGISESEKHKLFQNFSQVDSSLTRKYGGLGTGLVKANKLVKLMGGTLTVTSKEGEGSVFTVKIPVK